VKEDPNVIVMAYAYVNYAPPPSEDIKLASNILVGTVPDLFFPRTPDEQQWVKDQWLGWRHTGCSLFLRPNYMLHGYVMPHVFAHQFADEFEFEWRNGMVATDFDSLTGQWATQGTDLYALMRLHTQADRPIDDVLSEYYSGFGPAAEQVKSYFDYWENYTTRMLETAGEQRMSGIVSWATYAKSAWKLFPPESFGPALQILSDALQATGDEGEYAERVRFLQVGLEHAMLCARVATVIAGADPEASPFAASHAVAKLADFRREHEMSFASNLNFAAYIESRSWEIPEGWDGQPVAAVAQQVAPLEGEPYLSLRGGATMLALLGEGEAFRAHVVTGRVGANDSPINWVLVNQANEVIKRAEVPVGQTVEVEVPVPAPGTYAFFVQTNKNNAMVTLLNDHAALTGRNFAFIHHTSPVYFQVPAGTDKFTISFQGSWPGETVRVRVHDPDGNEVASDEVTRADPQPLEVAVGQAQAGKPWSLSFEKTDRGVLEDYRIWLSDNLPPFLALAPDRLVEWAE